MNHFTAVIKSKLHSICFHEFKIYNIPTWTFKFYLHHMILNEKSFHWNWDKGIDKIQTTKHEVRVIQAQDKLNVTAWNDKNLLLGSTSERYLKRGTWRRNEKFALVVCLRLVWSFFKTNRFTLLPKAMPKCLLSMHMLKWTRWLSQQYLMDPQKLLTWAVNYIFISYKAYLFKKLTLLTLQQSCHFIVFVFCNTSLSIDIASNCCVWTIDIFKKCNNIESKRVSCHRLRYVNNSRITLFMIAFFKITDIHDCTHLFNLKNTPIS